MSVKLLHRKYSGFFPFNMGDVSTMSAAQLTSNALVPMSLTAASKLFWLSKTCSWRVNLAYHIPESGTSSDNGTVTGSGSGSPLVADQYLVGVGIFSTATVPPNKRSGSGFEYYPTLSLTGTIAGTDSSGNSYSVNRQVGEFSLEWFSDIYQLFDTRGLYPVSKYKSKIQCAILSNLTVNYDEVGSESILFPPSTYDGGPYPVDAVLNIVVDGESISPLPLGLLFPGSTVTGSVDINFDTFWS